MGPCELGQVGNEAAISSSFQVRWASHRGPAEEKIQNSKSATRKRVPRFEIRIRNGPNRLEHFFFVFWICFVFRDSDFGFLLPWS